MKTQKHIGSARERILETAERLFYQQGYQATGVNQIIDESGVAKATFYSHFPAKDDLCLAYLEGIRQQEEDLVRAEIAKRKTPLARYMAPIEILEPWLIETTFRGCAFLNLASEIPERNSPLRKVGEEFYRGHSELVQQAVRELKEAHPEKYQDLNARNIAQRYMVIFLGVVGLCEIFQDISPLKDGVRMVKELVGE